MDAIGQLIERINIDRIRRDLFYLSQSPLPVRKACVALPGHGQSTLDDVDDFLVSELSRCGYRPRKEPTQVQSFGFDASKPRFRGYAMPPADAPWYTVQNVYAEKRGERVPDEIVVLVAHKDSQSWIDSPGAYDNAIGTATILEFARLLADHRAQRTIRFLWCNEEHRPWTSVLAAEKAKQRGDKLIAVFNVDSIGGKAQADIDAGVKTNVTLYTTPEGKRLAERVSRANEKYKLGLKQSLYERKHPGDDDGSFVKAGFAAAIANLGSMPYMDPNYHNLGDTPDKVDLPNVHRAAQAILAAVLETDDAGAA